MVGDGGRSDAPGRQPTDHCGQAATPIGKLGGSAGAIGLALEHDLGLRIMAVFRPTLRATGMGHA